MRFTFDVDARGPVFDGRATQLARRAAEDIEQQVADYANDVVHAELDRVLRNPTPYYETQVKVRPAPPGLEVSDGGVIYGAWLEGVGSRNHPVTRFKGYQHWQRARQAVRGRAKEIAERVLSSYVARM